MYNGDGVRIAGIADGQRTDYVQDVAAAPVLSEVEGLPQVLTARQGETVSRYLRGLGLVAEQTGSVRRRGATTLPTPWALPARWPTQ